MYRGSMIVGGAAMMVVAFSGTTAAENLVWNFNIFGPPRAVTAGIEAMRDFYAKESNGALEIKIRTPSTRSST